MDYTWSTPLASIGGWILLALRVLMGVIFLYHGFPKIRDLKQNAENFNQMGFKPGILWGTWIAFLEVFGGILLILGAFTAIFAMLFGFQMLVGAIWKATATDKKFADWSHDLLILGVALMLLSFGPGEVVLFTVK
jgi:putative oxidoreductase